MHLAICNSVAAGVTYAVAAGNSGSDLAGGTPAAYDEVLTATAMADFDGIPGGTGQQSCSLGGNAQADDAPAFFSDFATSADEGHTIAAPGVCILSTGPFDQFPSGTLTLSGTSMSSPHVAGTIALCIANGACSGLTPAQIIQKLRADAAAFTTTNPGYGFTGDPLRPSPASATAIWSGQEATSSGGGLSGHSRTQ
jgi:subtilisin